MVAQQCYLLQAFIFPTQSIFPCVHSSFFIARHDIGQPNLSLHKVKITGVVRVILRTSAYIKGRPGHREGSSSAVS